MRLKKLAGACADMDMPAVAVTDKNNLFAALEFSIYAADAGVQPIIGCQFDLAFEDPPAPDKPAPLAPIVLLAQSEVGYENLMKLNSCLYVDKGGALPQITFEQLTQHSEDVICLTGGALGPIGEILQRGARAAAKAKLQQFLDIFQDRLYVELQRHPGENGLPEAEQATERGFIELAYEMDIPLVATNDVYFPNSKMYEAHDALICIAEGAYVDQQTPRRRLTAQHYFKSPQEMATLFADA